MKLLRSHSMFATLLIVVLAATIAHASSPNLTFAPASIPNYDTAGTGADQVILADLNLDGILDAVVCNTSGYSVFMGNGDGTFTLVNTYPTSGSTANLCAVADINGDYFPDIVATTNSNANGTGGGVDVLLGDGTGNFSGPTSVFAGGFETFAIAVGDINNDGIPDLVVTSNCQIQTCLDGNVTVLLGNFNGTFQFPQIVSASPGGPVALGDMNHDGKLDIVFNGGVLLNGGTDSFGNLIFNPATGGQLVGGVVGLAVADINGDGYPDVIQANDDNKVYVLLGNGTGDLTNSFHYGIKGYWPLAVTVADVNGDGLPDVVVSDQCQFIEKQQGGKGRCNSIGYVSILTNKGGVGPAFAGLNPPPINPPVISTGYEASSTAVADINGDGKPDLVITDICATPNFDNPCASDGLMEVMLNTTVYTTGTKLTAAFNPSLVNQPVLLTATVTSTGGVIKNGDAVTFYDGQNTIGTRTTTNGVATLSYAFPAAGQHFLRASFGGDTWNAPSSGLLTQTVDLWTSTTSVTSNPNPSNKGQQVTLTANVVSGAPGGASGSVSFKSGATNLGSAPVSGGVAILTTTFVKSGSHTVTASYGGDTQSAKSSGTTTQNVN